MITCGSFCLFVNVWCNMLTHSWGFSELVHYICAWHDVNLQWLYFYRLTSDQKHC